MSEKREKTYRVASFEANEIQLAIEVLNRYGFEHHIANLLLQRERDKRYELMRRISNELTS